MGNVESSDGCCGCGDGLASVVVLVVALGSVASFGNVAIMPEELELYFLYIHNFSYE